MASLLPVVNVLVSVGSIDGMAASAAYLRQINKRDVQLIFTQAFQVNKIEIAKWPPNSQVGFIDLGVNNEGTSPNPQMTIDFVKSVYELGHKIRFIADGHGKQAWKEVLEKCDHQLDELAIQPENREECSSSCAVLKKVIGESADSHTKDLLTAGEEADKMNFETTLGHIFNACTKSNITDTSRRVHVVQHVAFNETIDAKMLDWMGEYNEMKRNLPTILASRQDLGDGISLYDCTVGRHDAKAVFQAAYKKGPIVVLKGTPVFVAGKPQRGVSIATNDNKLNILKIVQDVGISAGGMAAKANFALEHQDAAIEAVRKAIKG